MARRKKQSSPETACIKSLPAQAIVYHGVESIPLATDLGPINKALMQLFGIGRLTGKSLKAKLYSGVDVAGAVYVPQAELTLVSESRGELTFQRCRVRRDHMEGKGVRALIVRSSASNVRPDSGVVLEIISDLDIKSFYDFLQDDMMHVEVGGDENWWKASNDQSNRESFVTDANWIGHFEFPDHFAAQLRTYFHDGADAAIASMANEAAMYRDLYRWSERNAPRASQRNNKLHDLTQAASRFWSFLTPGGIDSRTEDYIEKIWITQFCPQSDYAPAVNALKELRERLLRDVDLYHSLVACAHARNDVSAGRPTRRADTIFIRQLASIAASHGMTVGTGTNSKFPKMVGTVFEALGDPRRDPRGLVQSAFNNTATSASTDGL